MKPPRKSDGINKKRNCRIREDMHCGGEIGVYLPSSQQPAPRNDSLHYHSPLPTGQQQLRIYSITLGACAQTHIHFMRISYWSFKSICSENVQRVQNLSQK